MKKTIIASAIAATLNSFNASADIVVTSMVLGETYAVGGTFTDSGDGNIFSIDPFFGQHWTATQETVFMDNTGSWSSSSLSSGTGFNYDSVISEMSEGQAAVGMFFDWSSGNSIAVLEIFDCVAGVCTGNGVAMDNGPFIGSSAVFSGTGDTLVSAVPIPAAAWLMGSGLFGLISVARRRK